MIFSGVINRVVAYQQKLGPDDGITDAGSRDADTK
jgi:hypothetical protein